MIQNLIQKLANKSSYLIVTFFYVGKVPFVSGTIGSLFAFPLFFVLVIIISTVQGEVSSIASPQILLPILIFIMFLCIIAIISIQNYTQSMSCKDPKEVVIDEVVGQLLTITMIIGIIPYLNNDIIIWLKSDKFIISSIITNIFLPAFILFRLFDILKPWPINIIDKNIKNGFGVMLDDILAALMSTITYFFIIFAIDDIRKII